MAIARALVTVQLSSSLTEPTGDLDRHTAEEVIDLLDQLQRDLGKTIIMVTHDPKAAARWSYGSFGKRRSGRRGSQRLTIVNNLAENHEGQEDDEYIFLFRLLLKMRFRHRLRTLPTMVGLVVAICAFGFTCARLLTLWYAGVEVPPCSTRNT